MLNTFYLIAIILGVSGQSIVKKPYTQRFGDKGSYLFVALSSVAALLFFVFSASELHFDWALIPHSAGFALVYVTSSVFMILSIAHGSLALSSLVVSYSLLIPTLYGVFFLRDPLGAGFLPGLLFLAVSLFLINGRKGDTKISVKWAVFAALAFVGNGMCTVVQKMQQLHFDGAYKNEFMILALSMVCVSMLILCAVKERQHAVQYLKHGWGNALVVGGLNGMVNLFVMILSARMAVSLMFPLISAGGLIITFLVARFWYKEPLEKSQLVGFLLGLIAVVLLNI